MNGRKIKKECLCTSALEEERQSKGFRLIAGVDEVGRGALAGPVVAAAVVLDLAAMPKGLDDSKRLTARQRERLDAELRYCAVSSAVARIEPQEIDSINIHQASLKAMAEAVKALDPAPDFLLVDGFRIRSLELPQQAVIGGDRLSVSIAAASIVAKVARDRIMKEYDLMWPGYGFASNVGYGTALHLNRLRESGPTPIHRRSFSGVTVFQLDLPLCDEAAQGSKDE